MPEEIHTAIREYFRIWRETEGIYSRFAKKLGLSYHALLVLYALWEQPNQCSQKQICQRWVMTKQTVHSILKEFEARGYITLTPMEADRRNKRILFSDAGLDFAQQAMDVLFSLEERAMLRFSKENRDSMIRSNQAYLDYLTEEIGGAAYEKEIF